jgi:hypothetical protein
MLKIICKKPVELVKGQSKRNWNNATQRVYAGKILE